jgi:hypothetical protein
MVKQYYEEDMHGEWDSGMQPVRKVNDSWVNRLNAILRERPELRGEDQH